MKSKVVCLVLGASLVPSPSFADPPSYLDRAVVAEATRRAVARAGLGADVVPSLVRRARNAALLPDLTVRIARGTGLAFTQLSDNPNDRLLASDSLTVDVRASFSLDRLVFAPQEPSLLRSELTRTERRMALEALIVDLLAHLELLARRRAALPQGSSHDLDADVDFARTRARVELLTGTSLDALSPR